MGAVEECRTCRYRVESACHQGPPGILMGQLRVWPTIFMTDRCGRWRATQEVEDAEWEAEKKEWEEKRAAERPWWRFWR